MAKRLTDSADYCRNCAFIIASKPCGACLAPGQPTPSVGVFALAYYTMIHNERWGELQGNLEGTLMDCAYFPFTVFTTLGFGDIQPSDQLRYLTGIESLTGLVLITWTASFLYLEMRKFCGDEN